MPSFEIENSSVDCCRGTKIFKFMEKSDMKSNMIVQDSSVSDSEKSNFAQACNLSLPIRFISIYRTPSIVCRFNVIVDSVF